MLRRKGFSAAQLEAIVKDLHNAGLEPARMAMMALAQETTLHANQVTAADVDDLRARGFTDKEILDIVLAAAALHFLSLA